MTRILFARHFLSVSLVYSQVATWKHLNNHEKSDCHWYQHQNSWFQILQTGRRRLLSCMHGNVQDLPENFRVPTLSSLLLWSLYCQNEETSSNWVQVSWMSIMPRNSYQKGKDSIIFPPLLPLPLFQFWMSNVTSFVKRVLRVPMFHFKNSWNMSIFSVSKLSAVRNSEEIISWVRKVFCQISKKSKVHFWIMY